MYHVEGQVEQITFRLDGGQIGTDIKCFGSDFRFVAEPALIRVNVGDVIQLEVEPRSPGHFKVLRCTISKNVVYSAPMMIARPETLICTSDADSIRFVDTLAAIRDIEVELIRYLQKHPERMRDLHSDTFEKLVAEILAFNGFETTWTGRNRSTAGDILALRRTPALGIVESYLVECKRYAATNSVSIDVARTLYGAVVDERRSGGILVTTSRFESGVLQFANSKWNLHVKDFDALEEWLQTYLPRHDGMLYMGVPGRDP